MRTMRLLRMSSVAFAVGEKVDVMKNRPLFALKRSSGHRSPESSRPNVS